MEHDPRNENKISVLQVVHMALQRDRYGARQWTSSAALPTACTVPVAATDEDLYAAVWRGIPVPLRAEPPRRADSSSDSCDEEDPEAPSDDWSPGGEEPPPFRLKIPSGVSRFLPGRAATPVRPLPHQRCQSMG